jgi:predicted ribosomally synthesized peptide with nif11-like leader
VKSQALALFLQAVAQDAALQAECGAVTHLAQLVAVAQGAGYRVTARELQLWAHHEVFSARWWPWAGQPSAARIAFFRGQPS